MSYLESVQQIYAAFGSGDIPRLFSFLDPQIVWEVHNQDHGIPWIQPGQGMEAAQRFFGVLGQDFQVQGFSVDGLCDGGDVVTALVHMQATIPSTGGKIDDHEIHVWYFNSAGKVRAFRHVVDTLHHLKAAGKA